MRQLYLFLFLFITAASASAQSTGSISGKIIDKHDQSELMGVTVRLKGTAFGTATDKNGKFVIKNIKKGEYTLEITYIGYKKVLETGIKLKDGESKDIGTLELQEASANIDEVVVVGKKPLIDIDRGQSINSISQENIELAPSRQIQKIINTQAGVVLSPAGVSIRGSRTYETGTYIDGVSVTDPLAGTGFGLDIGANSIGEIEITTGGIGAEYGNATAGVISTRTRTAGSKLEVTAKYNRDNFGFNKSASSCWNNQTAELNIGTPLFKKLVDGRLKFNMALRASFSDEYYKNPANQVTSSLLNESGLNNPKTWTPYEDNRWSSFFKLSYDFKKGKMLTGTMLRSITVNQDVNMLRIFGNDAPFSPGYQFPFSQQMDNANTFTHSAAMQMINFKHSVSKRFSYNVTASRLLVELRADANGLPWRPTTVDRIFDPASIVTFPVTQFPTGDPNVGFVNPASGLYNNNGVATLWHHHALEEYVLKAQGNLFSRNSLNKLTFGFEMKYQDMMWIDIQRPWIGAPLQLPDGSYTKTDRLGSQSDLWHVFPRWGGFYVTDQIKYKGLVASVGGRLEYWAPGKFVDDAVNNPASPIISSMRSDFLSTSTQIGGLHYKFRFLPKINATFPIAENKMLFFNYGHTTILPHPSYVYPGLDPNYQDRSSLAKVGNPNLNQEVDISYEIGLKSQLTSNDALTISAYSKDKYDFITSASVLIPDVTGREVSRTIRINSDYARSRGIEITYIKRIGTWYQGQAAFAYSVSTGQSASANQSLKDILASGNVEDTKEYYLPWDCPYDFKTNHIFKLEKRGTQIGIPFLNNMSLYFESVYRSGVRYTPYIFDRNDPSTGRPIWVVDPNPDDRWSKIGPSKFWADVTITKSWRMKRTEVSMNLQITNVFNNKNASIINPVTGRAYKYGDDVPDSWVDPRYVDPRLGTPGQPPTNPARYLEQRHFVFGIQVKF